MTSDAQDRSPSVTSGMLLAGKYRIDRLLGEGGMGVVLAATNEALRQKVAIKLLRSGALANSKALGRFEREARAAASLRSEHVARVLDVGKLEDGRPYMVMEYLDGRDLGDVIDKGPDLSVGELVDFVLQTCEAVAEAHAAGIIHRDLKPRNLFLTTTVDGRPLVKVLDFGISKTEDTGDDMSLTRTTEIIGSPSYMSPEQLRASKEVDVRTDIWALGVILYELLTKKVPFQAVTVTEFVAVVLLEPTPDLRLARPNVPEGVIYAIERCLAKRREERFSSIAELVGALAPFGTGMVAGIADRVTRVAQGSVRALAPSETGSGPYALPPGGASHGGARRGDSGSGSGTSPLHAPAHVFATTPMPLYGGAAPPAGHPSSGAHAPAAPPAPSHASSSGSSASGSGSARLNIHGGTSVAWGETQIEAAGRKSRLPLVAGFLGGAAVLVAMTAMAVLYVSHNGSHATAAPSAPPAESAVTLPPGRKDLPPLATVAVPGTALEPTTPVDVPSALPDTRVPTSEGRDHPPRSNPPVASSARPPAAAARPPSAGPPPAGAGPKPDDLSNIGRR